MKSFTDIFIRRPVLALVVSLVIIIAGLQAIPSLNVRQYPRSEIASVTVHDGLRRRERGIGARLYHHAARTRHRRGGRHRLPGIAKFAGRLDHHRAPQAELRLEQGALRDQFEGQPGAQRSAAGSGSAGDQYRAGRFPIRLRLSQLHVGYSEGEPDHRLPHPHRAAAPDRARRRAAGGDSRRTHLRDAHLAQARPHGRAQHQPVPGAPGAGGQ